MSIEIDDLTYGKYICNDCGKHVIAHTFEDVVKYEKKCADCRVIDVTGGFKPKHPKKVLGNTNKKPYNPSISLDVDNPNNLRRDISKNKKSKHKKILSPKEKLLVRQREEEKWERIRMGYKVLEV